MAENLIVFDVDGTLYQTDIVSVFATQKALEELKLPVLEREVICSFLGDRMDVFCQKIAPELELEKRIQLNERIGFYEMKLIPEKGKLFEGIENMLQTLADSGYTLAICSFASRRYIDTVLNSFGIAHFFKYIKSYEPSRSKVELLKDLLEEVEHYNAIMVGDRMYDINAAEENAIPCIGVLYGYGREEALLSDFPAESPDEVVCYAKEYFKGKQALIV